MTQAYVENIVKARRRRVGNFTVRRVMPSRERRTLGPFVFLDHMGPHELPPGQGVDVPPHPHIHLATVTYLFQGELVHRDSLGSCQSILPGDINWMHAGSGIVHSERTGSEQREAESEIEGVQLWVALPKVLEESPPRFEHYPQGRLGSWVGDGVHGHVLAGSAFESPSSVETSSPALLVDVVLDSGGSLVVPKATERGVYVVRGSVFFGEVEFEASELAVFRTGADVVLEADQASRILILGGDPLDGQRHMWWNFVSSDPERIEQAKADWKEGRFPPVPGDDETAPLPE